jgi:hypothetical protein
MTKPTLIKRLIFSAVIGVTLTMLLGLGNYVAMRSGYERVGNLLFKVALWSWPIFGAFFDFITNTESTRTPNRWGGYTALLFDVALISLLTYAILWVAASRLRNRSD